jgi:hypothetical protein
MQQATEGIIPREAEEMEITGAVPLFPILPSHQNTCLFQFKMFFRFPLSIGRSNMKSIGRLKTQRPQPLSLLHLILRLTFG